jgi:hypothetical protein
MMAFGRIKELKAAVAERRVQFAARELNVCQAVGEVRILQVFGRPPSGGRLPMTEKDLEIDQAGGDG